jgi:hypothetical protein
MNTVSALDTESVTLLKNAFKRRLLQLNDEIRKTRKEKKETKLLNAKRKIVNQHYNLLEQLETKFNPQDQTQQTVYFNLLDVYKNG